MTNRPAYADLVEWERQPAQVRDVCDGVVTITLLDGTHRTVPVERLEVIHGCPPDGSGLMPCCGRTPFEVPRYHRMTEDPTLVTCGG